MLPLGDKLSPNWWLVFPRSDSAVIVQWHVITIPISHLYSPVGDTIRWFNFLECTPAGIIGKRCMLCTYYDGELK